MRELHESVYLCATVIHANIVSNKAPVNNQKLRHSSSANSKSVGPPTVATYTIKNEHSARTTITMIIHDIPKWMVVARN